MNLKDQSGFTLVEILTALAILAIIFLALNNSFLSGVNTHNYNQEKIDFQQIHRVINARIAPYVRIARKIDVNPNNPPDDHILRLYFNDKTINSDVYAGIAYSVDSGNLRYSRYLQDEDDDDDYDWGNNISFLSEIISDMKVSYDNSLLTIEFTLESERGNTYTFTETFYSRFEDVEILND